MGQFEFTTGQGVDQPLGQRLAVPEAGGVIANLCRALTKLPPRREAWFTGAVFDQNYRTSSRWRGQRLVLIDADYHNAAKEHAPLPTDERAKIECAVEADLIPGNFAYLTPRGLRVGFVLEALETNAELARHAQRGAANLVDAALLTLGVTVRVDRQTLDLARLMFLPNATVRGEPRDAEVWEMRPRPYTTSELAQWDASTPLSIKATAPEPRLNGHTPHYLTGMLAAINADTYDTWIKVGMALKHSFGESAFTYWDHWSAKSRKYPGTEATRQKWDSFTRGDGPVITFDTVRKLAREAGWSGSEVFSELPDAIVDEGDGSMIVVRADAVTPRQIDWLWRDRFPVGRLSLISAPPGAGKSYLSCFMASHVSRGATWPDEAPCARGSVVLVTCEDDPADTIVPRLIACGAELSRVHLALGVRRINPRTNTKSMNAFTLEDLAPLDKLLSSLKDARLVIIDPIGSYFGGKRDSYVDTEVRALLAPLALLAQKHNVAIVLIAHTRKSAGGSADDSVLGSRAFTGLARAVHHVFRDEKKRHRRLLLPGKSNLGIEQPGLAFALVGSPLPNVIFEPAPVKVTADEMMMRMGRHGLTSEREPRGATLEWLRELLHEGPKSAGDVRRVAHAAGLSWRTVQRACRDLGVKPRRIAFAEGGWVWALPRAETLDISAEALDLLS